MNSLILLLAVLGLQLQACVGPPKKAFSLTDHFVRKSQYWEKRAKVSSSLPVLETAPAELIEYLRKDNQMQGYTAQPVVVVPNEFQKSALKKSLRGLPVGIQRLLRSKLSGIFLVRDLGSSAYTNSILDSSGKPVSSFMVFDERVFSLKANDWLTAKENSPFLKSGSVSLTAFLEDEKKDRPGGALFFLLLHELGHVASLSRPFHPSWDDAPSEKTHPKQFEFSRLSWGIDQEGRYASVFDSRFYARELIHYYGSSDHQLEAGDMISVYNELETTDFPTLYAATNPFDDFAESFATYIYKVVLGKTYRIEIKKDGKLLKAFEPCWGQPRCEPKAALIKSYLQSL